jgi:multiple sugar transport system substrate-binding protein
VNDSRPRTHAALGRRIAFALAATVSALAFSACSGGTNSKSVIVLVDSTRLAGVQSYEKSHPNSNIEIQTIADRGEIPEKVLLDNRAADGSWPDVVFAEPNIVSRTADAQHHFPLDLSKYVPKSVLRGYSPGALKSCTINGKLACLPNDLAQEVLWYNAPLMKKFGYTVPKTWAQYQALGLRVAKEHPGYVIGAFGSDVAVHMYFWPSDCPIAHIVDASTVQINLAAPTCTRVADMIQPLIKAGSITTLDPLGTSFVQKYGSTNKMLMMPAASWFAEYVFKTTYHTPKGQLAAAPTLTWPDQDQPHAGTHGGSAWMVSSHTRHVKEAVSIARWMSTSTNYQATAPTYPAYRPAAEAWGKRLRTDAYFQSDPFEVLKQAADQIDPFWGSVRYDPETTFTDTVLHAATGGRNISSAFGAYQSHLTDLAKDYGYKVVRSDTSS